MPDTDPDRAAFADQLATAALDAALHAFGTSTGCPAEPADLALLTAALDTARDRLPSAIGAPLTVHLLRGEVGRYWPDQAGKSVTVDFATEDDARRFWNLGDAATPAPADVRTGPDAAWDG